MKKKTAAKKKNPGGQVPRPTGNDGGHKNRFMSKSKGGFPVKNYST